MNPGSEVISSPGVTKWAGPAVAVDEVPIESRKSIGPTGVCFVGILHRASRNIRTTNNMDTIETNLCTLSRHVLHDQRKHKEATGDLTLLLISVQLGCKFVSSLVRKAGLANL
jgi:hypothetical protein